MNAGSSHTIEEAWRIYVCGDKVSVARSWLAKLEGYHFRDPRGSHTFRSHKSVSSGSEISSQEHIGAKP
jgi:hypothetical protein